MNLISTLLIAYFYFHSSLSFAGNSFVICFYQGGKYANRSTSPECANKVASQRTMCCGGQVSGPIGVQIPMEEQNKIAACRGYIEGILAACSDDVSQQEFEDLLKIRDGKYDLKPISRATTKGTKTLEEKIAERTCLAITEQIKTSEEGEYLVKKSKDPNTKKGKFNFYANWDVYYVAKACANTLNICLLSGELKNLDRRDMPWFAGDKEPDLISGPSKEIASSWCYQALDSKKNKRDYLNNDECIAILTSKIQSYGKQKTTSQKTYREQFSEIACRPKNVKGEPLKGWFSDTLSNTYDKFFGSSEGQDEN